jgi:VWFA-related protein
LSGIGRTAAPARPFGRHFVPILAWSLLLGPDPPRTQERSAPPVRSGLVETTGVSLILVDVEVTDEHGNPMRGLTRKDFTVLLDGRKASVYSVDDLCSCSEGEAAPLALDREPAEPAERPAATPAARDDMKFILYLDYSQLQQDGRVRAGEETRRWIRETMRPGDLVMLAAYASDAGLVVLADFTADKAALIAALEAAERRVDLNDSFATLLLNRQRECARCCKPRFPCNCQACLWVMARKEYVHSKHSLEALERLFQTLELVPGRKSLILFHQNGTLFPSQYYGTTRGDDHISLLDRVASEATLARTAIHVAYSGDADNPPGDNFGANLADFTGGSYNRGAFDIAAQVRAAGRRCACIYRLGLVPPAAPRERPYRVTVRVGERTLPHQHRVVNLSDSERWGRSARAVLATPTRAHDVALAAAVIPLAAGKRGWDVSVQVTLDADALLQLPRQDKKAGSWEVGALLSDEGGRKSWEMLSVSEFKRSGEGQNVTILHERRIDGLRPGTYELRAFVRDRLANVYGGARAEIVLPRPAGPTVVGPIVTRGHDAAVRTTLPLLDKAGRTSAPARSGSIEPTALPLGDRAVRPGEALEFWSWICPGDAVLAVPNVARYVALNDEPLFRFESPAVAAAGACTAIVDRLDSTPMAAGDYTYHLHWDRANAGDALQAETAFTVRAALQKAEIR